MERSSILENLKNGINYDFKNKIIFKARPDNLTIEIFVDKTPINVFPLTEDGLNLAFNEIEPFEKLVNNPF